MPVLKAILVVTTITLVSASQALSAEAVTRSEQCRRSDSNGYSDRDVRQTIRCAVGRWSVPGGVRTAVRIAKCESGLDEHDSNPTSSAKGVYQFIDSTWRSVRSHYRRIGRRYELSWRVFSARANVLMAIRYAHAGGWDPWTCS